MGSRRCRRSCAAAISVVALLGAGIRSSNGAAGKPSGKRFVSWGQEWTAYTAETRALFRKEAWDELETRAKVSRDPQTRFRSGRWKLDTFYDGFWPEKADSGAQRDWAGSFARLERWRAARPRSATALTALAEVHIGHAWEARGAGYAGSVADAGWRLFASRIKEARSALEAAVALGSRDPQTYLLLLEVARAQGWTREQRRLVLEKALGLAPCYHEIYFEEAFNLLPRWHGAPGDVERFAEQSVGRCKSEGEAIYARIVWNTTGRYDDDEFTAAHTFSWARARRGFEALLRQYPESRRNLNGYCRMACLYGDRPTARRLFERIGENWEEAIWDGEAQFLRWRRWAKASH